MELFRTLQFQTAYRFTSIDKRGYSSVVEHSTADREVPGLNPGVP